VFSGKRFNLLVSSKKMGDSGEKVLKFCNRLIKHGISKDGQISIFLDPGGSIAWDLAVESVTVKFEKNGDIIVQIFFENRQRRKFSRLTFNPI
jgi:hypothetical protein